MQYFWQIIIILVYYEKTDTLYLDLSGKNSFESADIGPDIIVDYDDSGNIIGFEIEHASKHVNIHSLITKDFPAKSLKIVTGITDNILE